MSRLLSWVGPATCDPGTAGPTLPTPVHDAHGRELAWLLERVLSGDLGSDDWADVERAVVSALAASVQLYEEHQVDEQGWCLICWEATREWWRPWRHRRACTVRAAFAFHMPHAATSDLRGTQ
ncbi:MAG: hypothetical protein ACRDRY_22015 [Pseudonocardiaceae bacterium]